MSEEISTKTKKKKAVAAAEPVVEVAAREDDYGKEDEVAVEAPVEVAPEPVAEVVEEVKAEEAIVEERLAEEPAKEVLSVDVEVKSAEEAEAYIEKLKADAWEKAEEVLKEEVKPVEAPKAKLTGAAALVATYKDASLTEEKASDKETPNVVVTAKHISTKLSLADVDVLELALEGVVEGFLFDAPTKGTERAIRNAVHNTLIQFDHQVAVKAFAVKFDKGTLEVKVSFIRSADNKQVDYTFTLSAA